MPINFFSHIAIPDNDAVVRIVPPEQLRDVVEGYYLFKTSQAEKSELFFNDGYPVIAFMQNQDEGTVIKANGKKMDLSDIWVCGGILNNVYCQSVKCFNNLFVVRFYPLTFLNLFDVANDCFQETQVFSLSRIDENGYKQLNRAYYNSSSREERIQLVSDFIGGRISRNSYPPILTDILHVIDKHKILSVADLLKRYNSSLNYKWLERNFKNYIGLTPKNYFSIRRFLNAYLDLQPCTSADLIKIAIDNGYCDDNHLIKDFKRFSGISPKKYFKHFPGRP